MSSASSIGNCMRILLRNLIGDIDGERNSCFFLEITESIMALRWGQFEVGTYTPI